jgi:hypothetical protein
MRVLLHGAVYSRGLTTPSHVKAGPSQCALNAMLVATTVAVYQTTLSEIAPQNGSLPTARTAFHR